MNVKPLLAEVFGTFWLVLGGCGAAVLAADFGTGANGTSLGLGFVGVSLAFGLTVLSGAYAVGHISGGHFNPAVTLGLVAGGRFEFSKAPGYIIAQVIGGLLGGLMVYLIASGQPDFAITPGAGTFATNGFGANGSPGGFDMQSAFLVEVVLTAVFLVVIMGATDKLGASGMGGLAIGLALTLIHLVSIPVTNTSVNPARSTSQATVATLFGDGVSLPAQQLWLFWAAPIIGAVIGAVLYRMMETRTETEIDLAEPSISAKALDDVQRIREERAGTRAAAPGARTSRESDTTS